MLLLCNTIKLIKNIEFILLLKLMKMFNIYIKQKEIYDKYTI